MYTNEWYVPQHQHNALLKLHHYVIVIITISQIYAGLGGYDVRSEEEVAIETEKKKRYAEELGEHATLLCLLFIANANSPTNGSSEASQTCSEDHKICTSFAHPCTCARVEPMGQTWRWRSGIYNLF